MNWWIKFGCFLTGWNMDILAQCSETSHSKIKKYASALLILIMLWGTTGFCFANRYMQLPYWACGLVSLAFITVVIQIERQIILVNGKNRWLLGFRVCIAIVMAVIGSTIIDQTIFGKDISKAVASRIEEQVEELLPKRLHVIDEKLISLQYDIDSLTQITALRQADFETNPFITQTTVTGVPVEETQPDGTKKTVMRNSVQRAQIVNPAQDEIKKNKESIDLIRQSYEQWCTKKQCVEEDTRSECKENVGFLEELEVMLSILTSRPVAAVFYIILFIFLVSLELFVAMSKMLDEECDYDQAIKAAQIVRTQKFNCVFAKIRVA